jgi:hypothetical protein
LLVRVEKETPKGECLVGWYASKEVDAAVKLYCRGAERNGLTVDQPSRVDSEFDGEKVVLRGAGRELARYRVGSTGQMRRMKTPARSSEGDWT